MPDPKKKLSHLSLRHSAMHLRIEYGPEGGGDPKAFELYSRGKLRRLTYEAMDEVLTTDISDAELTAITRLSDRIIAAGFPQEAVLDRMADSITLTYENGGKCVTFFSLANASPQWAALLDLWSAFEELSRQYFIPRFY